MNTVIDWTLQVPPADEMRSQSLRAKAADELRRLQALRFVALNHNAPPAEKLTQERVKSVLQVSQPEVHRMIRRVEANPELLETTPREIILRRFVGEITAEQMFDHLAAWPFTVGRLADDSPLTNMYVRGSFDDVADALREGFITTRDYEQIQNAAARRQGPGAA